MHNFASFLNLGFRGPNFTWEFLVQKAQEDAAYQLFLSTGWPEEKMAKYAPIARTEAERCMMAQLRSAGFTPEDYLSCGVHLSAREEPK